MRAYTSAEDYFDDLSARTALPEGFSVSTGRLSFFPKERPVETALSMSLALISLDEPSASFGAVFTRNAFPGAPVLIGRRRLAEPRLGGFLVNTKVSNVCAPAGAADAEEVLAELGRLAGRPAESYAPASTGIIGWSLPVPELKAALPDLAAGLHRGSAAEAARAIMTTDSYPKAAAVALGQGRLVGLAKGAGMIEPNMATMLVFILTDVSLARAELRESLRTAVDETFNCISVDSDQSTSDSVYLVSSNRKPAVPRRDFETALGRLCAELAQAVVRNGEGTAHVLAVEVEGAAGDLEARAFGKAVVNSPLVKTAVFGNDPNVGRLVSALGDYAGNAGLELDQSLISISLGGEEIFKGGSFSLDKDKEARLAGYLKEAAQRPDLKGYPQHERTVDIKVGLGRGRGRARVFGSDLSYEYVRENADYRS